VVRFDGEQQSPVTIAQCRITIQRDCLDRVVVLAFAAAEQGCGCGEVQGDVGLQLGRPDDEGPGGYQYRAPAIGSTCINRSLQRRRIERFAVTFSAEVANVVNTGARVLSARAGGGGRRSAGWAKNGGECRNARDAQPLASGESWRGVVMHKRWVLLCRLGILTGAGEHTCPR